jgi:mono/diheme cytochrome c family protein
MRLFTRIAGALVVLIVLAVTLVLSWAQITWRRDFSSTPMPAVTASRDPAVIERGAYVVHAVAHCTHCHGDDLSNGPLIDAGPFGRYAPTNLTRLAARSDGEIARAVRNAVDHDGALAPMMLVGVGALSDEDLIAVVSYLRTLTPRGTDAPADEWGIVAKLLAGRFQPRTSSPPAHAAMGDEPTVARGSYLANGPALCVGCHTARDPMQGFALVGAPFAGDPHPHVDKVDPAFEIVAPNITHVAHGTWSEDAFVERFRAGPVHAGTIMPWVPFAKLSESDVRSIHRYLKTLTPVNNDVGPTRRPR